MSFTTHYNLPEMPTGAVDWPTIINDIVAKLERGRTYLMVAGETLVKGDPVYLASTGKVLKADNTTAFHGVWLDASTVLDANGFMQRSGYMTTGSGLTIGGALYVSSGKALTQVVGTNIVGFALTATSIVIEP